ncbi:ferritin family protein [Azospirillum sp.]|uniref:ferritin family protein n=1 Tax=Azospirillum sp. TaxID=34012 RepID=UPI003D74E077
MPLLHHEPTGTVRTLEDLLGIATAMERDAVRRYTLLAGLMERRGEYDTAATFRRLVAEEEGHVEAVDGWARTLGLRASDGPEAEALLPPEIAASWRALSERTRLTPHQALSLAVLNEQRAFAFYSYIAAASTDDAIRLRAEELAHEELRHAALLRHDRRAAYHRERRDAKEGPARAETPAELERLVTTLFSAGAAEHAALAAALHALGDASSAALVARIAEDERRFAEPRPGGPAQHPTASDCLRAAFRVSERLAEAFGDVAEHTTDEEVLIRAQHLQELVIGHLTELAERIETLA